MAGGDIEWIARGLLVRRGEVLLCRNAKHGYSYLPGGHIEFGESAEDALRREFVEETSLDVTVGRALAVVELRFVQKSKARHEVSVVFHVEHDSSLPVSSVEPGIEFHWVALASLDTASIRPALIQRWLIERSVDDPLVWLSGDERP